MKKLALFFLLISGTAYSQIETPAASPMAKLETTIGLTPVKVEYSRPGVKGRDRSIFGGLEPYGEVWRTGANASTKITFEDSVQIMGKSLAPGTYALYTIPNQDEWTVIFNNNTGLWGATGYKQEEDALRVKVKPTSLTEPRETFTIDFSGYKTNSANLDIMWDFTKVSVPITVDTDTRVMAQINKALGKPEATAYYRAANYYYQNKKDKNQALTWINQALDQREHYAFYLLKASLLAETGNTKEARKAAEKSKAMAKEAGNNDYVKMNDDLISRLGK
jgi:hypothetical protein